MVNLVLLVISAIAAVVAAIFAVRADVFSRSTGARAMTQRQADIRPRLTANWLGMQAAMRVAGLRVSFTNAGGAATRFVWVGQDDTSVAAVAGTIPQHTPGLLVAGSVLGEATYRTGIGTTLLIAEDVQGRWWDCQNGEQLTHVPDTYMKKRMEQVALSEFTESLIAYALRPLLRSDYVG